MGVQNHSPPRRMVLVHIIQIHMVLSYASVLSIVGRGEGEGVVVKNKISVEVSGQLPTYPSLRLGSESGLELSLGEG